MFMITSRRIIAYGAKKLMKNNIISGNGEKYYSAVAIMFPCFDVKV